MKAIHKYPLTTDVIREDPISDAYVVLMPALAEIISVEEVSGVSCVYALVDPSAHAGQERHFRVFSTGQEIPPELNLKFIGTTQKKVPFISLVYHVFEEV
jgi:hypothetical protein